MTSARGIGAQQAVLLLRNGDKVQLGGRCPADAQPPSELLSAARKAFREPKVLLRSRQSAGNGRHADVCLAYQLRVSGRPAVVAFSLRVDARVDDDALLSDIAAKVLRRGDDQVAQSLPNAQVAAVTGRETGPHRTQATPEAPAAAPVASAEAAPAADPTLIERQGRVLESLACVLDQDELERALHELANQIARSLRCQRVTVGLRPAGTVQASTRVRIAAVSGEASFDRRATLFVDIAAALTETCQHGQCVQVPLPPHPDHKRIDGDASAGTAHTADVIPRAHAALAETLHHPALLSVPLVDLQDATGALLLERDRPFTGAERASLEQLALLITPVIALKRIEALTAIGWLKRLTSRSATRLVGKRQRGVKLTLLALAAITCWSLYYPALFRIDADASIEAERQRVVVAAFSSYLGEIDRRPGDLVQRGDVLAKLDASDLELERIKWQGELAKLQKEYRAILAKRDRSQVRVLQAQISQAQSQLDLLDLRIARATIRAPIDGVVVSGDWAQALGRPVDQGERLFEVAALEDFNLVLMVDEADIGWVATGGTGALRLRSMPGNSYRFRVQEIAPVSESGEGSNRFRVKATFDTMPPDIRPGMGGIAKIDIDERPIGWIWSRKFADWARLQYWRWTGS
ncbi:MAG: HlyD family efflux transporter periplasmic adaptor subunit [Pseudomonadota bacterium]